MKLILASGSPRRKELLKENGFFFTVIPSGFSETNLLLSPVLTAKSNALGKAKDVFSMLCDDNIVVLGADTIVVLDGKILGKPTDSNHAKQMLKALSGKTHQVITAYALISKAETICEYEITDVTFNKLSDGQIEEYVKTGSPLDKAGAYGIQDGFNLVKEINGSYNNVVGLPIEIFKEKLERTLK